jgi:hypothetical protein
LVRLHGLIVKLARGEIRRGEIRGGWRRWRWRGRFGPCMLVCWAGTRWHPDGPAALCPCYAEPATLGRARPDAYLQARGPVPRQSELQRRKLPAADYWTMKPPWRRAEASVDKVDSGTMWYVNERSNSIHIHNVQHTGTMAGTMVQRRTSSNLAQAPNCTARQVRAGMGRRSGAECAGRGRRTLTTAVRGLQHRHGRWACCCRPYGGSAIRPTSSTHDHRTRRGTRYTMTMECRQDTVRGRCAGRLTCHSGTVIEPTREVDLAPTGPAAVSMCCGASGFASSPTSSGVEASSQGASAPVAST